MSSKLMLLVAGLSLVSVVGCSQDKHETHEMRDDQVRRNSMTDAPSDKPSTRPGQTQLGK